MKELRCLVFTNNELVNALVDRRRRAREAVPEGTVRQVSFKVGDTIETKLEIEDDYGHDNSIVVPHTEVVAALVQYCLNRKIPLPVKADKFLQIMNDCATLTISVNFSQPVRNAVDRTTAARRSSRTLAS